MKRIGIFGGTFNPVHNGHLQAAQGARVELSLEKLIWVPCKNPPLKGIVEGAEAEDRYEMVKRAIAGTPAFRVSRIELDRGGPSYSVDTVYQLKSLYDAPGTQWYFLLGSDAAEELSVWKRIETLLEQVRFAVIQRPGIPKKKLPFSDKLLSVPVRTEPISASEIRRRVKEGESIEALVPAPVAAYIREKGLYRGGVG
ncbi:MAG: nicotinate (nicotinamide) nucleotide adenylyltransferase [Candidatus Omnitrophica bacterium CG11_big_fil_rev_8_21_14_0_20_64_10]|nr:MAG: nicotinate (nicotinamide) nucleotide adenylyltransferase [Candidatus Omnitrophica bacterium CG11_big_fil_rev_8_21_14_0_20_64_10]